MKNTFSTTTRPVHQFWNVLQFPLTRIILASVFVGIGGAGTQVLIALLRRTIALDSPLPILFVLFEIIIAVLAAYGSILRLSISLSIVLPMRYAEEEETDRW